LSKEANSTNSSDAVFDPVVSRARFSEWFPDLTATQLENLLIYQGELFKFNKAVNLVSPQTLKFAEALHFADAILASRLIEPNLIADAPLYDFGSGNGFPGLVIAMLQPKLKVVLVDRDERKLEFCKHVASSVKLTNLSVQIKDVEALPEKSLMNVVARGFAPLFKAMMLSRKSIASGGRFFHLKGDAWATELAQVPPQLLSVWAPSLLGRYSLPDARGEMAVVMTEKLSD
jgi:16S rRNA (guanine527-N7)-methyltransferase